MYADEAKGLYPESGGVINWGDIDPVTRKYGWMQQIVSFTQNTNIYNCRANLQCTQFNYFNAVLFRGTGHGIDLGAGPSGLRSGPAIEQERLIVIGQLRLSLGGAAAIFPDFGVDEIPGVAVASPFRGRLGGQGRMPRHRGAAAGRTAVARDMQRARNEAGRLGAGQCGKASGGYRRLDRGWEHTRKGVQAAWREGTAGTPGERRAIRDGGTRPEPRRRNNSGKARAVPFVASVAEEPRTCGGLSYADRTVAPGFATADAALECSYAHGRA